MNSLTLAHLAHIINNVKKQGYDLEDVQIVIGDDDELNGVHVAWGYDLISDIDQNKDEYLDIAHSGAETIITNKKMTLFIG